MTPTKSVLSEPYEYEPPEVWVRRFKSTNEALKEAAASGCLSPRANKLLKAGTDSDRGEIAFIEGRAKKQDLPHIAFKDFIRAFMAYYLPAIFEIEHLLRTRSAAELGMSPEQFVECDEQWTNIAETLRWQELEIGLLTGTRPIMWQSVAGAPSASNVRWGGGSLFMMQRGNQQFAVTARHVATNVGANTEHFRLLLPDTRQILPVLPPIALEAQDPDSGEHQGDILIWQINVEGVNETAEWWAWRLEGQVKPASDLTPGQKLYCVGFPEFEENFDAENFDLVENPFIMSGILNESQFVDGLFTMNIDEHLPEVDLNGMSGGPVFARFDERFHYVGLAIRGVGKRLNFISSEHVLKLLNRVENGIVAF